MSALDPQSTSLVEALRSEATGTDSKERVRARLTTAGVLGAAACAPALAAAQAPALALAKSAGWLGLAKLAVLGIGVMAVGALAVVSVRDTRQVPSEVAARARPAVATPKRSAPPAPVAPSSNEHAAREPVAPVTPPRTAPAQAKPQRRSVRRSERSPSEVASLVEPASSTLAVESALLARALRALNEGRSDEAHTLLREHAERFPAGMLVRERERALERLGIADVP